MRSSDYSDSKRKYSRISIKKRESLVAMVLEKENSIACAARRLGIKASTARMILNKYRRTGTFPMKKFKKPMRGGSVADSQRNSSVKREESQDLELIIQSPEISSSMEGHQEEAPVFAVEPVPQLFMMYNLFQGYYMPAGLGFP